MKYTQALVLEDSDFTKDKNLKSEAFFAITKASLVVHGSEVIKNQPNPEGELKFISRDAGYKMPELSFNQPQPEQDEQ